MPIALAFVYDVLACVAVGLICTPFARRNARSLEPAADSAPSSSPSPPS
jgi:hypothetical protein